MEKKNNDVGPKKDTINIKVKKKKANLLPFFLVIIVIAVGLFGIIFYGEVNSDKKVEDNNVHNDNVGQNIPNINDDIDVYEDKEKDTLSDDAKRVYETLENATWASKTSAEKINIFKVENGKLECLISTKRGKINFNYGKIKFLRHIINNGELDYITVLTEDGKAYIAETDEMVKYDYDLSRLEFSKVDVGEEIIDITFGDEKITLTSYGGPYYLTKSGRLLSKEGEDYYKMNKEHINSIGVLDSMVYVNRDKSLEILRNNIKDRYLDIIDKSGNKIIAKDLFINIENSLVTFYVLSSEDVLYTFSNDTMFVAEEYSKTSGKKIKKIEYNMERDRVRVVTDNSRTVTISDVSSYINLDN